MKKRVIPLIAVGAILVALPIATLSIGLWSPSQFDESYYGELSVIHRNLKETKGKKVVLIGNSAVAFGVRSDLLDSELSDYSVVNFGLYGAIGTKAMLDLSEPYIQKDDVVIILPEPYRQTSSLYYSANEMWRGIDPDHSILYSLPFDERNDLLTYFPAYVGEKLSYLLKGEKPSASAPYNRKSFIGASGENRGFIQYERPYNIMAGGYDSANMPLLGEEAFGKGFIDYLNSYAKNASNKGAKTYFGFAPVNNLCVDADATETGDKMYDYLSSALTFPLLGHPARYFMDYRYFYDNNVHMNTAGMTAFTNLLASDLKLELGIMTPNSFPVLPAPDIPAEEVEEGDNRDEACFLYEERESATGRYVQIVGLTEQGRNQSSLILPSSHNGLPVRGFDKNVFAGNTTVSQITLPSSVRGIEDYSFDGAIRLAALYFQHDSVLGLSIGMKFLEGADKCYLYVKNGVSLADCAGGWEIYQSRIRFY